tara:strand:- start:160 stop:402 length:243 start_codon:yes stop_codon:yes gene_type:complete
MITFIRHTNSRDKALELVEEGLVSADDMLTMALKYMSTDDVEDMLDCNELSDRFSEEEDEDEDDEDILTVINFDEEVTDA